MAEAFFASQIYFVPNGKNVNDLDQEKARKLAKNEKKLADTSLKTDLDHTYLHYRFNRVPSRAKIITDP